LRDAAEKIASSLNLSDLFLLELCNLA